MNPTVHPLPPTVAGTSSVMDVVSFGTGPMLGRFGNYDLVARLGQGGMAGVYLAVARGGHEDFRKLVVLKVLHENLRSNEAFVDMFVREARIAADLAHPNVVHTYNVEEADGHYYLVMEYLDGVSLSAVLKKTRSWSRQERLPLLGALCLALSGLHYVHEFRDFEGNHLGLVHRDFKPGNIFITFDGQVKVLDFGVAKITAPEIEETAGQYLKGTVQYTGPEALDARLRVDRRLDVFSAGLIAWEIAEGRRVWGDRDHLQILRCLASSEIPDVDDSAGEMPDDLFAMCRQAMSCEPSGRQATALDFKRQLQSFLVSQGARIDTERLAAIIGELFGDLRERRTQSIREQLRAIQARGDDDSGAAVVFAHDLPVAEDPSNTGVETIAPPTGARDDTPTTVGGEEPRSSRGLFIAGGVIVGLLVLIAYLLGRQPATSEPVLEARRTEPTGAAAATTPRPEPAKAPPPTAAETTPPPTTPPPPTAVVTSVVIHAQPQGAEILVDGQAVADNPTTLSADDPSVVHHVTVRAPGHATQEIDVQMDRSRDVSLSLEQVIEDGGNPGRPGRRGNGRRRPRGAGDNEAGAGPAASPTPAAPAPGDDLPVERRRKKDDAIDEQIPWGG